MTRHPDLLGRKSVLYIEDHPVNAILMRGLFKHRPGLELVVASNGQQALCLAAWLQPALILLDLRLPDCHGSELLPRLRRLRGCENTPAVAVTADCDFAIEGTGFVELWPKPMNLVWVLQRLDALTGRVPCATPVPGVIAIACASSTVPIVSDIP